MNTIFDALKAHGVEKRNAKHGITPGYIHKIIRAVVAGNVLIPKEKAVPNLTAVFTDMFYHIILCSLHRRHEEKKNQQEKMKAKNVKNTKRHAQYLMLLTALNDKKMSPGDDTELPFS